MSRSKKNKAHPPPSDKWWPVAAICLILFTLTWLVFGQTLGHEFVNFDDNEYVYENHAVRSGLTFDGLVWAFTHSHSANWHPLTWLSHMLDCQLFGLNAGGHHLTNVLLHTTTAVLLFLVLRRMTAGKAANPQLSDTTWRCAFVTAIFSVHPLRVESVAWIAERKDVLSAAVFLLTLGAYVRYVRLPWSPLRYGLVMLLFALGLMAKPMLVTLPLILLLLDYWPLNRLTQPGLKSEPALRFAGVSIPRRVLFEKLPLLALTLASCAATLWAQQTAVQPLDKLSLETRLGNAAVAAAVYLWQIVWPVNLVVFYPLRPEGRPFWEIVVASTILAAISAAVFLLRRTRPYLLTGWLWYLIMLAPVVGILQVGAQARADRYTYLPHIGILIALTWLIADLTAAWKSRRIMLGAAAAATLTTLVALAYAQTARWRNTESLWTHTLACLPNNHLALNNVGNALLESGRLDEALDHFRRAVQIAPTYADAHNNLGTVLLRRRQTNEGKFHFSKALEFNPRHPDALNNLGNILLDEGRTDEAIARYQRALEITPDRIAVHNNLGNAYQQGGRIEVALAHFHRALEIDPKSTDTHYNLGNALRKAGRLEEAIAHYRKAAERQPRFRDAHYNLGNTLLELGRQAEAIPQFGTVIEIDPDFAQAHYVLGNLLLQSGRADKASIHFVRVLEINPQHVQTHNNLGSALLQLRRPHEAQLYFQRALELDPEAVPALNNLSWLLATSSEASIRDGPRALTLAGKADQLTGSMSAALLTTLAAAYAESGQYDDAVQIAERAADLAARQGNAALATQVAKQLDLYRQRQPYRQSPSVP